MQAIISARFLASPDAKPKDKPFEVWDSNLKGFVLRVQPSGARSYLVQIARGRRVTLGSDGALNPATARTMAQKVLGNVAHQLAPLHGLDGSSQDSLGEFIEYVYTPWVNVNRPKTADYSIGRLKRCFGSWYRYRLPEITPKMLEEWKTERLGRALSPNTLHRDLASLSAVLTRAVKTGALPSNPIRLVDKPRIDRTPKVRYLSVDEEKRLRAALAARDARGIEARRSANRWRVARGYEVLPDLPYFADHLTPAVILSMNTGLRRGELLALHWTDIDQDQAVLTVTAANAKAGQTRHLPLNSEALRALQRWQEQQPSSDRVFPVDTSFKSAWLSLIKQAKIVKRFRWHDLRHHFASRLAQAGVPLNTIRELLGHGSIAMTLRYAHLAPDQRKEAVAKLVSCSSTSESQPRSAASNASSRSNRDGK
jgi:integrase